MAAGSGAGGGEERGLGPTEPSTVLCPPRSSLSSKGLVLPLAESSGTHRKRERAEGIAW